MANPTSSASTISSDSSLYGSSPPTNITDIETHIAYADRLPANIAHAARAAEAAAPARERRNPLQGQPSCWQLDESAAAFVARLPPSTTSEVDAGPWIWIANPYAPRETKPRDIAGFLTAGLALLDSYLAANGGKAASGRGAGAKLEMLKQSIRQAAMQHNVTCGKWMLFPAEEHVDAVWTTVCEATIAGELGVQAKIATAGAERNGRLICLYTHDFADEAEVVRVLRRMNDLKLVSQRGIWYKADAYTHLDINSNNAYGLKASIYGSKEMLSKSTSAAKKRQGN